MVVGVDDALAIAGLVVAIPDLINVIVRGGESIVEKVDTFRFHNEILNDYRELGIDVSQGTFKLQTDRLKGALRDRQVPDATIRGLESAMRRAKEKKDVAVEELDDVKSDGLGRVAFSLWGKRRLEAKYREFKNSICDVNAICTQISQLQIGPPSTFLPSEYFKVKHEVFGTIPGELLAMSDIREVEGNYSHRYQKTEGKFILESKSRENDVKHISTLLDKSELPAGVLRCLGYRQPSYNDLEPPYRPIFELVFEAPTVKHQSLAALITNEPEPTFEKRMQLARQVAKIVMNVHNLDLVHKGIRSRVILVANWDAAPKLYLTDWTYVRETSAATSYSGGDLSWPRMIYQHPERQGSPGHYPEHQYEPKHDTYSLGVVMLEIFLWKPFIIETVTSAEATGFSIPYIWEATSSTATPVLSVGHIFEEMALRLGEANGGLPRKYGGDSAKLASRPGATKKVWRSLATEDLFLVNQEASDVVSRCLDGRYASAAEVLRAIELIT